MTNEDEVLRQTEIILNESADAIQAAAQHDKRQALVTGEQNAWESDPLTDSEVYDVWVYDVEFQGTPASLAEWNATGVLENVPTAYVSQSMTANSCLSVSRAIISGDNTPSDVKELVSDSAFFFGLAMAPAYNDPRGLMVRTQAFASKDENSRPSEADDRMDVVVTCCLLYDTMVLISRDDKGEYLTEPTYIDVIAYDGSNHQDVYKCAEWLSDVHGEVCRHVYMAINIPLVMKTKDPEMWEATKQDLLARKNQQTEQE